MKLRLKCWSADFNMDERTLAVFEDGNTVFDQSPAQTKAIDWLEDILYAVKHESFIDELKSIQKECNQDKDPQPFPDIYKMPLCIVNLVLKKYELTLEEF